MMLKNIEHVKQFNLSLTNLNYSFTKQSPLNMASFPKKNIYFVEGKVQDSRVFQIQVF